MVAVALHVLLLIEWNSRTYYSMSSQAISLGSASLHGPGSNVGLGRLALAVERVELLLEPVLGRDTGVDRAAQSLNRHPRHHDARARSRSSKKRGPFQFVPVKARATLDRLVGVGDLLYERAQAHDLVSHRQSSGGCDLATQPTGDSPMTTARDRPVARSHGEADGGAYDPPPAARASRGADPSLPARLPILLEPARARTPLG